MTLTKMVEGRVTLLGVLIEQHRVALREGAAFAVLSRQAHRVAFFQQATEGKRLSRGPIDSLAGLDRLCAVVEETLDRLMDLEIRRNHRDLLADRAQLLDRNAGITAARVLDLTRRLQAGPAAVEPIRLVWLVALRRLELGVEPRAPVRAHLGDLALGDNTLADQFLAVDIQDARVRADL